MNAPIALLIFVYTATNIVGWLHLMFRVVDDSDVTIIHALAPMLDIFKDVVNPIGRRVLIIVYTVVMIPALLAWYVSTVIVFTSCLLSFIFRLIFKNQ